MSKEIQNLREDYNLFQLKRGELDSNPIEQFRKWLELAIDSNEIVEPNVMTLSTVSEAGKPSARIVLLKGLEQEGFIFYTNYKSKKGTEISKNNKVALTFWWPPLHKQVRIEGTSYKLTPSKSDQYFQSRPRGSQIGALVSPQSSVIEDRSILELEQKRLQEKFPEGASIPRPNHWGGYIVDPDYIEFWQGRQSRLHDRFAYQKQGDSWQIVRLAP